MWPSFAIGYIVITISEHMNVEASRNYQWVIVSFDVKCVWHDNALTRCVVQIENDGEPQSLFMAIFLQLNGHDSPQHVQVTSWSLQSFIYIWRWFIYLAKLFLHVNMLAPSSKFGRWTAVSMPRPHHRDVWVVLNLRCLSDLVRGNFFFFTSDLFVVFPLHN